MWQTHSSSSEPLQTGPASHQEANWQLKCDLKRIEWQKTRVLWCLNWECESSCSQTCFIITHQVIPGEITFQPAAFLPVVQPQTSCMRVNIASKNVELLLNYGNQKNDTSTPLIIFIPLSDHSYLRESGKLLFQERSKHQHLKDEGFNYRASTRHMHTLQPHCDKVHALYDLRCATSSSWLQFFIQVAHIGAKLLITKGYGCYQTPQSFKRELLHS